MTIKEIAKKYDLDPSLFESFLRKKNLNILPALPFGYKVPDEDVEQYVGMYREYAGKIKARVDAKAEAAAKEAEAARTVIISTTEALEGYAITKYVDCFSGEAFYDFNRGDNTAPALKKAMSSAREEALWQLRLAAHRSRCNAVVGVSFSYVPLAPQTATPTGGTLYQPYVVSVAANGTGVIVEKKN